MANWLAYYGNGYTAQGWTRTQRAQNVNIIASYLHSIGWTINAIAATLGNMEAESYINPAQWEHAYAVEQIPARGGFGLVQWTPWTKYTNWAGPDWKTNYNKQLYRIKYELDNGLQWRYDYASSAYPLSFLDFTRATEDVANIRWLAMCFFKNYEQGIGGEEARMSNAEYWYSYLQSNPPQPWHDDDEPTKRKFKIMFYLRPYWKRI